MGRHRKLHELHEIVRQSSDPEFAQLLNRLREGNHTRNDLAEIKALAHTDTSQWPGEFTKLYRTNALVNKENEQCMSKLQLDGNEKITVHAKDSTTDKMTGRYKLDVPEDIAINKTAGLPKILSLCVGARVMVTANIDISDKLINGSMGTVIRFHNVTHNGTNNGQASKHGKIFIQFDDPKAGNKKKDRRLRGELKECVPIEVCNPLRSKFQYKHKNSSISVERIQFPLTPAHAITIHKAQGSTLEHMSGDMDGSTKGKRANSVIAGMLYTLLSRAKSRDKLQLLNFEEKHINVNTAAVREMERMRKECKLSCSHPLTEMTGNNICLFNIRSWNLHIEHFISDKCFKPEPMIDIADMFSVPEHSSSPRTIDLWLARLRILLNSVISTTKEDCPLKILSLPKIRV